MKKRILLAVLLISGAIPAFSQLKVIDQIVGSLIPAITSGIKDVLSSSNKKGKIDSSQVGALKSKFQNEVTAMINQMSKDQSNIDILNSIFQKTSVLSSHISSMRTLCTAEILNSLQVNPNISIDKQIIKLFQSNWATFEDEIGELSKIQNVGNNAALQSKLISFANQVGSNLKALKSDIQFGATANVTTKDDDIIKYIGNLNSSSVRSEIDLIVGQIYELNSTLSGYISAFSASLKDGQEAIKEIK